MLQIKAVDLKFEPVNPERSDVSTWKSTNFPRIYWVSPHPDGRFSYGVLRQIIGEPEGFAKTREEAIACCQKMANDSVQKFAEVIPGELSKEEWEIRNRFWLLLEGLTGLRSRLDTVSGLIRAGTLRNHVSEAMRFCDGILARTRPPQDEPEPPQPRAEDRGERRGR